jgi:choline monooxygenase
MFQHQGKLSPRLPPAAYRDTATFAREREAIFRHAWHPIAAYAQLAQPGQYVARDVAGVPVVVRNDGGTLRAFENVCVHRHSMVVADGCGAAQRLRCQYHGWEYDGNGRIAKIPDATHLKGFKAKEVGLTPVRVERFGPMVMVNPSATAPPVREAFGAVADEVLAHLSAHRLAAVRVTERAVNWKVIVENAVESYHVPVVHPTTFGAYREEALHDHELAPTFTRYLDLEPWGTSTAGRVAELAARVFRPAPTLRRMTHLHVFPSTLLFYGDLVSDFAVVEPLGPERARHTSYVFLPDDAPRAAPAARRVQLAARSARTPGRARGPERLGRRAARQAPRARRRRAVGARGAGVRVPGLGRAGPLGVTLAGRVGPRERGEARGILRPRSTTPAPPPPRRAMRARGATRCLCRGPQRSACRVRARASGGTSSAR